MTAHSFIDLQLFLGTKFPPLELDAGGERATYNGGRHPGKRRLMEDGDLEEGGFGNFGGYC